MPKLQIIIRLFTLSTKDAQKLLAKIYQNILLRRKEAEEILRFPTKLKN